MGTRLSSSNGTGICDLLRKYNEGEWWFDSAHQSFHKLSKKVISERSMSITEAITTLLGLFKRMETERKYVLEMLPHYDPNEPIWVLHHSEIESCFDQLYPGCAEPLTEGEIQDIINRYKKGIESSLEDWEGTLRDAIELEAPREMEVASWDTDRTQ